MPPLAPLGARDGDDVRDVRAVRGRRPAVVAHAPGGYDLRSPRAHLPTRDVAERARAIELLRGAWTSPDGTRYPPFADFRLSARVFALRVNTGSVVAFDALEPTLKVDVSDSFERFLSLYLDEPTRLIG